MEHRRFKCRRPITLEIRALEIRARVLVAVVTPRLVPLLNLRRQITPEVIRMSRPVPRMRLNTRNSATPEVVGSGLLLPAGLSTGYVAAEVRTAEVIRVRRPIQAGLGPGHLVIPELGPSTAAVARVVRLVKLVTG